MPWQHLLSRHVDEAPESQVNRLLIVVPLLACCVDLLEEYLCQCCEIMTSDFLLKSLFQTFSARRTRFAFRFQAASRAYQVLPSLRVSMPVPSFARC